MAEQASDYQHGEMDIQDQEKTFHVFGAFTKWGSLITAVGILMLTVWFATDAGFWAGLISGLVVTVAGVLLLRERAPH